MIRRDFAALSAAAETRWEEKGQTELRPMGEEK
jgi:hypothetical protein